LLQYHFAKNFATKQALVLHISHLPISLRMTSMPGTEEWNHRRSRLSRSRSG